ncbi:MAG: hypothetical protein WBV94_29935 [Blastocatellia bacterium]
MPRVFVLNQKVPNVTEASAVGAFSAAIVRNSTQFRQLVRHSNPDIVFKNQEAQLMTANLSEKVDALAALVLNEFPGLKLRITEAWDNSGIHAATSRHREGRAVDITVSDRDRRKLGRLAGLAVEAEFDWVFFEDELHVHASVKI